MLLKSKLTFFCFEKKIEKSHYFWTKFDILGADRRELERIDIVVDSM